MSAELSPEAAAAFAETLADMKKVRVAVILEKQLTFFGALSYKVRLESGTLGKTAWTDGVILAANPGFWLPLPWAQRIFVFCHELLHCANDHMGRRGDRDPEDWNIATDMAINLPLIRAGLEMPEGALYDWSYDGWSPERIYDVIHKDKDKGRGPGRDPGPGGKPGQQPGNPGGQPGAGRPGQGDPAPDPGGCGGVIDSGTASGTSAGDPRNQATVAEWAQAVATAAALAKKAGALPYDLERMADRIIRPPVNPWRRLRELADTAIQADLGWDPLERRLLHRGIYFPDYGGNACGHIIAAVDTSASIDDSILAAFGGHLLDLAREAGVIFTVLYVDAALQRVDKFDPQALPAKLLRPVGGGGTDFRPAFAYADKLDEAPAVLVYLTDLDAGPCKFPCKAPGYPVIWACTSGRPAPWGTVLRINV